MFPETTSQKVMQGGEQGLHISLQIYLERSKYGQVEGETKLT